MDSNAVNYNPNVTQQRDDVDDITTEKCRYYLGTDVINGNGKGGPNDEV